MVILSGGHGEPVTQTPERYKQEIQFILETRQPILGICLGFELLAYAFGGKLVSLPKYEHGQLAITMQVDDPIGSAGRTFRVYENHRWVVTDPGPELIGLAKSKDGFEIIKHRTRPMYGFQFHPEMFTEDVTGKELFRRTLQALQL